MKEGESQIEQSEFTTIDKDIEEVQGYLEALEKELTKAGEKALAVEKLLKENLESGVDEAHPYIVQLRDAVEYNQKIMKDLTSARNNSMRIVEQLKEISLQLTRQALTVKDEKGN